MIGLGVLTLSGLSVGYGEALIFVAAMIYALHIVGLGAWSDAAGRARHGDRAADRDRRDLHSCAPHPTGSSSQPRRRLGERHLHGGLRRSRPR